ncbi:MerR family transcriptional regulator [Sutcliffiella halmapala]|uniref:MerR family transcriptional regulator n=1 Tax=Sutcliffiella halmapala TaxID=79882 RepID=UPI00099505B7|nr:MerR family DNA-binding transcriptional regulator [Sutcliffiella halmapala]
MLTISQLAKEFNVSTRTIRYYEELGLLKPDRTEGNHRIYSKREHARLKLIVRGKRYGFELEEIKEMVVLFDKDRSGQKQLERTIQYGTQKVEELNSRIKELTELKVEMEELLDDFTNRIKAIRSDETDE